MNGLFYKYSEVLELNMMYRKIEVVKNSKENRWYICLHVGEFHVCLLTLHVEGTEVRKICPFFLFSKLDVNIEELSKVR